MFSLENRSVEVPDSEEMFSGAPSSRAMMLSTSTSSFLLPALR